MQCMPSVREVFVQFVSDEEELEEFAGWAFGKFYRELDQGLNFMETWNYLHSNLLKLLPTGSVLEDGEKMVKLWKESKLA